MAIMHQIEAAIHVNPDLLGLFFGLLRMLGLLGRGEEAIEEERGEGSMEAKEA